VHRDADEQVVGDAAAAREPGLAVRRVELHDLLVPHILDAALGQGVEEALGELLRDRNRRRHRADGANLDRIPEAALDKVVVQQQRTLERRRRALERVTEDPDQDPPRVEVGEHSAHALRSSDRVVLDAALCEAGGRGEVVVRSERNDEDVGLVRGRVRRHSPLLRVDRVHPLAAELDAFLGDVLEAQLDLGRGLSAEQDVQLGEPEGERLILVDERRTDVAREGFGEARRQLQSGEAGTEDHDVRHAGRRYRAGVQLRPCAVAMRYPHGSCDAPGTVASCSTRS